MLSKSLFRDEIPALFDCQRRVVAGHARDAVGHYDRGGRRLSDSGQTKQALRMLNFLLAVEQHRWFNRHQGERSHRHHQLLRLFARQMLPAGSSLGFNVLYQPRRGRHGCGADRNRILIPALRLCTARGHQPAFCGGAARTDQDHQPSIANGQLNTISRYFLRGRTRPGHRNSRDDV